MTATETRIPMAEARHVADRLFDLLRPACERIVIAGSIRRRQATIGDIDLVCEPRIERLPASLFGDRFDERDVLHELCCRLVDEGVIEKRLNKNGHPAWGRSLKRATFAGLGVDIQACTDETTWGAWLLIRTGPASFNKAIVTPICQGGRLPSGFEWKNGFQLWRYGGRVETPTEASVFDALGMPHILPADRA